MKSIVSSYLPGKILFGLLLLFCPSLSFAQYTYYSCDTREHCDWDSTSMEYVNCDKTDMNSMFKLNAAQTMFEHTTPDLSSAYYVTSHEYDSQNNVEVYKVTSDVGNNYTFIVDTAYSEVRIVGQSDNAIYMLRFHIKSTWSDQ